MAKRFIDTGLFDDDWFMDLSKDAKLLWVYFITKCDHAGMLKLNEKLCRVQTDIKDLDAVIKQLGNRLVSVSERLYFVPKYIDFQYPGFPNSKVRQQQSALDLLIKYGIWDKEKLSIKELLPNSYDNDTDNDNEGGEGGEKKPTQEELAINFYTEQVKKAREFTGPITEDYIKLIGHICQKNEDGTLRMTYLLKVKNQLSLNDFAKLYKKANGNLDKIIEKVDSFQTNKDYYKKYTDIYLSVNKWFIKDSK